MWEDITDIGCICNALYKYREQLLLLLMSRKTGFCEKNDQRAFDTQNNNNNERNVIQYVS